MVVSMGEVKKMTPKEFRDLGYLQELNRTYLHLLGLALEVVIDEDGTERFGQVWDARDDPEGFIYDPTLIDPQKAERIAAEMQRKCSERSALLGFIVQAL